MVRLTDDLHFVPAVDGDRKAPAGVTPKLGPGSGCARLTQDGAQPADAPADTTAEAVPTTTLGVDVQRRMVIIVKGAPVVPIAGQQLDTDTTPRPGEVLLFERGSGRLVIHRADVQGRPGSGEVRDPWGK